MKRLINLVKKYDIILDDCQISLFEKYYELLIEKNKVMNLTTITELKSVIYKHFLDSIAIAHYYNMNCNFKVMDVGTGAGFPGIPLKIAFPNLNITLLDSLAKRVGFLNEVISQCNFDTNTIQAIHSRAEDAAKNEKYREQYDICVSRAVANLATLSEYCLPFVKTGGCFISYKSGNIKEELEKSEKAIHLLGGKIEKVHCFSMEQENDDFQRSFVIIKKINKSPKKYPRKAGLPSKEPLC